MEVSPVLSSGSDVAAASTVAPKMIPLSPRRLKNSSPLRSMTTPATSVAIAATPKITAARVVLMPWSLAAFSFLLRECPRGSGWLSGASPPSRQGRPLPARLSKTSPTTHSAAIATGAG
ncbi:MAG: hypothetical protein LC721_00790, partial [Actinobacteria bacterium]|nr:hypothetical protein [Actinomycetota bacterium]